MKNLLKAFRTDTTAALTVEWVIIVAAVVGITIAVLSFIAPSIGNLAEKNSNVLAVDE